MACVFRECRKWARPDRERGGERRAGSASRPNPTRRGASTTTPPPPPRPPTPAPPPPPVGGTAAPIKGPALRLLQNMEASLGLPTATSFREVDVTLLWDMRAAANAALASRALKLSFTHLVGYALV